MKWLAAISAGAVFVVTAGCRSKPASSPNPADSARERAAIEARATLVFTNAVLVKPRETVPTTDLAFTFAPLLMQEVAGSNTSPKSVPATIYYELGTVQIGGNTHPQLTYLWPFKEDSELNRGVRLTLDLRGQPVIWEVLDDQPCPRVIFVSESLEERAKAAFGRPVTGKRFAIERPFDVAPDVVVARAIDDGPTAMGPIVHQTASGEINAVICRCMPTQARQLVATKYYELKSLSAATNSAPQILEMNRRLVDELRLPPGF